MATPDWDPALYARFGGLRLRPALDLLARVPALPEGDVVDLGCGNGPVAEALSLRFPGRALVGIDSSPAMLAQAEATGLYAALTQDDAASWQPGAPPALIYSNACLQWLDDHDVLLPRLAGLLAPGGTLAVQMPNQATAPSHALMRVLAERLFPGRHDFTGWKPNCATPLDYLDWLSPLGRPDLWETEYSQLLPSATEGHPVRGFTSSTGLRPYLEPLAPEEQAVFVDAYDAALAEAYPLRPDGSVLFPFRRLFIVLTPD